MSSKILGRSVKYCLNRSRPDVPFRKGEAVVYFFHGIGGGVSSWEENGYAKALDEHLSQKSLPPITFVSFDTAAYSFFSDAGGYTSGPEAYETWLIREFIPFVETQHNVCRERSCRAFGGVSMGGFGALKMALKYPETVIAAAGNSPALAPFSIFEADQKWQQYFSRHPIGWDRGFWLLVGLRRIFTSRSQEENNDPTTLLGKYPSDKPKPDLYFDVGEQDDFGFQEGHDRFKNALNQSGTWNFESWKVSGNHKVFESRATHLMGFLGWRLRDR
jgi:S-formylglutathione hydrolase FrmB